ncbi:hypothetical protein FACS189414_3790 [Bacteroidia bacterium]|nr:hypothetical protein FACS189414_3790 [Bacteroidia bacterium]
MQFKLFTVPTSDDGSYLDEVNKFLRSHKVLEVEQQLVNVKNGSQWHFCIKYIENAQVETKPLNASKVDYKEVLDEKTFAIFSLLRETRKKIAGEDSLPVYAVFTNEELAGIATLNEITTESIKKVNGIGDKKAELIEKGVLFERFINHNLQLSLKPFVMNKTEHGLPALGFILFPNQIQLNSRSKKRFATKLTNYTTLLNNGYISEKQFAQCILSLYGFISHANSKGFASHLLQRMNTNGSNRVNRGGSWNNSTRNVRVPNRNNNAPDNRNNNLGFRLASSTKQQIDFEQVFASFPEKGKNNFNLSGK